MRSNQKAELGHRDEVEVSRKGRMREDDDHCDGSVREDSNVTRFSVPCVLCLEFLIRIVTPESPVSNVVDIFESQNCYRRENEPAYCD